MCLEVYLVCLLRLIRFIPQISISLHRKGIWWGDVKSIGKEKWELRFVQGKTGLRPFVNDNKTVFPIHYIGLFRFEPKADISLCFITAIHFFQFRFVGRLRHIQTTTRCYGRACPLISKMFFFVLRFLKKVVFFLKEREIKHSARPLIESNGKLLTPGDITKKVTDFTKGKVIRHDRI